MHVSSAQRRSQDFLWGALIFPEKVDDLFLFLFFFSRCPQTLYKFPKFPQKNGLLLCLGVHLQLFPVNLLPHLFLRPGGARAPCAQPGYACAFALIVHVRCYSITCYILSQRKHSHTAVALRRYIAHVVLSQTEIKYLKYDRQTKEIYETQINCVHASAIYSDKSFCLQFVSTISLECTVFEIIAAE